MWTGNPASPSRSASNQCILLAQEIAGSGLRADPRLALEMKRRIRNFADAEWNQLDPTVLHAISPFEGRHSLGAGFALTAFLIAPVPGSQTDYANLCSFGAIVNLMAVVCDRLLDSGSPPSSTIPTAEIAAGGGDGSAVMLLLRQCSRRLQTLGRGEPLLRTIEKGVRRMFDAEGRTVRPDGALPYRFWLRKSALPFVVMALPAWSGVLDLESRQRYLRHLRWLYGVGRFFGAIDDAADILEDSLSGHPNCWLAWQEKSHPAAARRVATWGKQILVEWDSLVPRTIETAILRETFLFNIWEWLEPAACANA
jgi:hypothetical protein